MYHEKYPYVSMRNAVYSTNGMVATSQNLASSAGLDILRKGGNAIDAAVATAACLTVVEPTSNGIGGDNFALVWANGKLHGLNSSGPSGNDISIEKVKQLGHEKMPTYGVLPVTVPGAVAGWEEILNKFGSMSMEEVLTPAIQYAKKGFVISPTVGYYWRKAYEKYKEIFKSDEYKYWFDTFTPNGKVPEIGEIFRMEEHGHTLEKIAKEGSYVFYKGEIADKIDTFFKKYGGFLTKEDLKNFKPEWVDPISVKYRGYDIWEIPPNGQGIVCLIALGILNNIPFESSAGYIHKQIEAIKIGFSVSKKSVTDEKFMKYTAKDLLSPDFLKTLQNEIGYKAQIPKDILPQKSGTVYLTTADNKGNMVSFIQSNYMGFGSGIVIPNTGISMHNRGADFSLDEDSVNKLEPNKRTYHTIIPAFITKDNKVVASFGVMGGYMQPQGHLQVVTQLIDKKLNPQSALDAPRWQWLKDNEIEIENTFEVHLAKELELKGHDVKMNLNNGSFGRGQIIASENGVLIGGCEPRCDSDIASY
ncbi:MAG: gamma-glutamyltransferase [Defluviitaleaceae bacterium]|nr:gamma-glutamyltransferase [Defluviitaleaceae bacterium]